MRRGEQAADEAVPDDGQFAVALPVGRQIDHLDEHRTGRVTVIDLVGKDNPELSEELEQQIAEALKARNDEE